MAVLDSWNSGTLPSVVAQNGLGTVTAVTAGPSNPPGQNLIRNHDFELGDTAWGTNSFTEVIIAAPARSGTRLLRMDVDAGNRWPLSERLPTEPGWTYSVTAWYRRQSGASAVTVAPLMATYDAAGTQTLNQVPAINRGSVSSTTWTSVTWEFTVPAGAVFVAFAPWAEATAGCVVDVDDVDARLTSAFPQTWMEFDQSGTNNLAAVFNWGVDTDEATVRFYFGAPEQYADGLTAIGAWQTMPGPTTFVNRVTVAGQTWLSPDEWAGRPGMFLMTDGSGELASTNLWTIREDNWHRIEFQYRRTGTAPIETRARLWRTGSDLTIWDSGWEASSSGNATCAALRLGAVSDQSTTGLDVFGIAHVEIRDEITTIGRHSSDALIPARHRYRAWIDGELVPAVSVGVWNGTTVVPITDATAV